MPLRWRHFAIAFFYRLEKSIRVQLARLRKYHKVVIKEETFQKIKNHEMFIAAIQLSRSNYSALPAGLPDKCWGFRKL